MACEPVVPFMQVMVPALALTGSILVLVAAVILKSAMFAVFERSLPRLRAAWRMFVGNVLTSFVGLLVGVMIASGVGIWIVGVSAGQRSVLAAIAKARQGRSSGVAGENVRRRHCRDHDQRPTGKLHSVHGRPRRDQESSTHALLDHQAHSHLSRPARKRHAYHSLGRMGRLAAQFAPRGQRVFRIGSPHESVCPGAGHGGSRCAHPP